MCENHLVNDHKRVPDFSTTDAAKFKTIDHAIFLFLKFPLKTKKNLSFNVDT